MRRSWLLPLVAACALVAPAGASRSPQNPQTTPVFRSGVQTVAVYATVRDRDGRLVPDLTRADFEILDDGKAAELRTFSNEALPFTAVLLLDMSNSMNTHYVRVVESARHFVQAMWPTDRLRIGTYGREVAVSPWLTSDKTILLRILTEEIWSGGATPMWRGAKTGMDSLATETGRRVIVLVTDGSDSGRDYNCAPLTRDAAGRIGPCPGRGDVRQQALDEGFMFYAIGMQGEGLDVSLTSIVDDTGGGRFDLKADADLDETFTRVIDELHHQYALGFVPLNLDGKTHKLEVRLSKPGLKARARTSYLARGGDR